MELETKSSVVERRSVNRAFLLSFVFTLGIGAIQYGYSIGVYNAMQVNFQYLFGWKTTDEVNLWNGLITSVCALGSAFGSLFAGAPADRYGKLRCIHFTNLLVGAGCLLTLYRNEYLILCGRFIFGLATGAFSVFVPSFINELSPNELKGSLGSLTQILITLGIFISNALGLPLLEDIKDAKPSFLNDNYWRVIFGVPIVFALIQSLLLMTIFKFETPKYLKQRKREEDLENLMKRIYSKG